MEQGFKERAENVMEVIASPATGFILVASPNRDTVEEATFFSERLTDAELPVSALIVNRMHPRFSSGLPEALRERAAHLTGTELGGLYRNLADFALVADREEQHLAGLSNAVKPAPIVRVPFLRSDVHDLDG